MGEAEGWGTERGGGRRGEGDGEGRGTERGGRGVGEAEGWRRQRGGGGRGVGGGRRGRGGRRVGGGEGWERERGGGGRGVEEAEGRGRQWGERGSVVVSVARLVDARGDLLVLDNMGISLQVGVAVCMIETDNIGGEGWGRERGGRGWGRERGEEGRNLVSKVIVVILPYRFQSCELQLPAVVCWF